MKPSKILKTLIYLIIITFLFSYSIEKSGYYEYNLQQKKNLTAKEIKQFEEDIKNGKEIDLNTYLKSNTKDYTSNLTNTTSKLSIKLNKYLKKTIHNTFNIIEKLIK